MEWDVEWLGGQPRVLGSWLLGREQMVSDKPVVRLAAPFERLSVWAAMTQRGAAGFGQFTEVGPVDMDDKWREFAWTERAHVLFVDNPVGTGFSYVEEGGTFGD